MTLLDYERVIAEMQQLIEDTKSLMADFESSAMDTAMASEYQALLNLHRRAVTAQRNYTLRMLERIESDSSLIDCTQR